MTLTSPEGSNSTKVARSCVHSFRWLRSLLLVVKSENRDECKIVRLFPIGVDCVKLVHLRNVFFFQTAVHVDPVTGIVVLLFSGFVVYFGAILKYMQWLYDTAGKPQSSP